MNPIFCKLIIGFSIVVLASATFAGPRCESYFLQKQISIPNGFVGSFQRRIDDTTFATMVDTSQLPPGPSFPANMVKAYQNIQKDIYGKRLSKFQKELSEEEIKVSLKNEEDVRYRSLFMMLTKNDPVRTNPEFLGGVRVVTAKNRFELLPFEKDAALNLRRDPNSKVAAEIGRLILLTEESSAVQMIRSKELIRIALQTLYNTTRVDTVYVHTSAIHKRLYRSMGFETENVVNVDKENQVLIFNRQQLENFLRQGSTLAL